MQSSRGVIYYNLGTKCLTRLVVAVYALRKKYNGPATIITEGDESNRICNLLKGYIDVKEVSFSIPEGEQPAFLKKTLLYLVTPYKYTVFMDTDTLVRGDFTELFELSEKNQFVAVAFSDWSSDKRLNKKRLNQWLKYYPDKGLFEKAYNFGHALNAGVYAFDNEAKFLKDWYKLTVPGRHLTLPEETCMQLHLHKYPHYIADQKYNCSCKYSKPHDVDTRIIHFHGRKHCRPGLIWGGDLWMKEYEEAMKLNIAGIREWSLLWDKTLSNYYKGKK